MALPEPIAKSATALKELFASTEYTEWDKKYNVTKDLEALVEFQQIKNEILERDRMGRLNYSWYIQENIEKYPDSDALVFEGKTWSWKEFGAVVDRMALWWASIGIRYKDCVAIIMSNSCDFIFAWMGLVKSGGVPLFIDFNLKGLALQHVLSVCPPRAIIMDKDLAVNVQDILDSMKEKPLGLYAYGKSDNVPCPFPLVHPDNLPAATRPVPCPPAEAEDLGLLLYTSGTTGLPKGWYTSHTKKQATSLTFTIRNRVRYGERVLVLTPLYHGTASLVGFGSALSRGATTILLRKFSATTFWQTARETKATQCIYVGEIPRYLMNQPPSPNDKNHYITAFNGLGMRKDIWIPFKKRFNIPTVTEYWGQTESPFSHRNRQDTAADGTEPFANYLATLGPLAREAFRIKLVRQDTATQEPYINSNGHFEEVGINETGHFIVQIDEARPFSSGYYNNPEATQKKVAVDPFGPGSGSWYKTGDLMVYDGVGWRFMDRSGDTFRWKGENVATSTVEMVLMSYPGINMANVYGVKVPHQEDGRAGMALLTIDENEFKIEGLAAYLSQHIPRYARPLWIRISSGDIKASGMFKLLKTELASAAMDPSKVDPNDKMYFLDETTGSNFEKHVYKPWSAQDYADLLAGRTGPGGHQVRAKL